GNLPVRFDEREQETELRQTGLRRVMRKHPNSHREAKATAPVLDSTRQLRLSCTHFPCPRNLLRVLELVLLQPTTCDLRQSFVPKLVPALFQAETSDCTPECTKGSRSANGIQQLAPDLLDVLCSRESLHD